MNRKKALIVLADGFEEIEAIAVFDVLKRAGVLVTLAGLQKETVQSARGIKLTANILFKSAGDDFDALVLPGGGEGAKNLSRSDKLANCIKKMNEEGKIIAAICASPVVVLSPTGILSGKKVTCYPSHKNELPKTVTFLNEEVVVDSNIITSQGPGTATLFGLKLAELLVGEEVTLITKKAMLA